MLWLLASAAVTVCYWWLFTSGRHPNQPSNRPLITKKRKEPQGFTISRGERRLLMNRQVLKCPFCLGRLSSAHPPISPHSPSQPTLPSRLFSSALTHIRISEGASQSGGGAPQDSLSVSPPPRLFPSGVGQRRVVSETAGRKQLSWFVFTAASGTCTRVSQSERVQVCVIV